MGHSANGAFRPRGSRALRDAGCLLRAASGLAIEAGWAMLHASMMYPLGLFSPPSSQSRAGGRHDLRGLSPELTRTPPPGVEACRDTDLASRTDHRQSRRSSTVMERALRRRGFQTLLRYDYGLLTHNTPRAAARFGGRPLNSCPRRRAMNASTSSATASGPDRPLLRATSRAATVAYTRCVTLGTHQGTQLAWAAPLLPLVRQLTLDRR